MAFQTVPFPRTFNDLQVYFTYCKPVISSVVQDTFKTYSEDTRWCLQDTFWKMLLHSSVHLQVCVFCILLL